jgi:hypothetical protein
MIRDFIPDPDLDFIPIPDPGSRGQKGTGSRIRNTAFQTKIGSKNERYSEVKVLDKIEMEIIDR